MAWWETMWFWPQGVSMRLIKRLLRNSESSVDLAPRNAKHIISPTKPVVCSWRCQWNQDTEGSHVPWDRRACPCPQVESRHQWLRKWGLRLLLFLSSTCVLTVTPGSLSREVTLSPCPICFNLSRTDFPSVFLGGSVFQETWGDAAASTVIPAEWLKHKMFLKKHKTKQKPLQHNPPKLQERGNWWFLSLLQNTDC